MNKVSPLNNDGCVTEVSRTFSGCRKLSAIRQVGKANQRAKTSTEWEKIWT